MSLRKLEKTTPKKALFLGGEGGIGKVRIKPETNSEWKIGYPRDESSEPTIYFQGQTCC